MNMVTNASNGTLSKEYANYILEIWLKARKAPFINKGVSRRILIAHVSNYDIFAPYTGVVKKISSDQHGSTSNKCVSSKYGLDLTGCRSISKTSGVVYKEVALTSLANVLATEMTGNPYEYIVVQGGRGMPALGIPEEDMEDNRVDWYSKHGAVREECELIVKKSISTSPNSCKILLYLSQIDEANRPEGRFPSCRDYLGDIVG